MLKRNLFIFLIFIFLFNVNYLLLAGVDIINSPFSLHRLYTYHTICILSESFEREY